MPRMTSNFPFIIVPNMAHLWTIHYPHSFTILNTQKIQLFHWEAKKTATVVHVCDKQPSSPSILHQLVLYWYRLICVIANALFDWELQIVLVLFSKANVETSAGSWSLIKLSAFKEELQRPWNNWKLKLNICDEWRSLQSDPFQIDAIISTSQPANSINH